MFAILRRHIRPIAVLLIAAAFQLAPLSSSALAKNNAAAKNDKLLEADTSKSYVLPYGLVILGVALGVMLVARPGTRADDIRRKKADEEEDD